MSGRCLNNMRILIVTIKSWNISSALDFKKKNSEHTIEIISEPAELTNKFVQNFNPDFIFFPHWSWIIPKEIHENFKCIVFHITDLPFGRGGSPLQNLIVRCIENTKISAISVTEEIDAGNIYFKRDLSLNGNAEEILVRAAKIIFNEMIPEIINGNLKPFEQEGDTVYFERRKPNQSEVLGSMENIEGLYNHIRMLDGEGYPKAYIKLGKYKMEFSRASYNGQRIIADVIITEGESE